MIKVIKKLKMCDYTEDARFAVMRRPNSRFHAEFKMLYERREQAETQALALATNNPESIFFVVELIGQTSR